jgi:hypothetical protein
LPQVLPAGVDGCLACAGYSLDLKHVRGGTTRLTSR